MRKLKVFMHVSLDGFVAGMQGEMDWIRVDAEIFDFTGSLTDAADAALYGRVTFQMMDAYWPNAGQKPNASKHDLEHSAWYNRVDKYVLSKSLQGQDRQQITILSEGIAAQVAELKQQAGKDILIFGSPGAVHTLMQHDLIDEFGLYVNPVLLGRGIRLFEEMETRYQLRLIASKTFASGVICLHYERQREA